MKRYFPVCILGVCVIAFLGGCNLNQGLPKNTVLYVGYAAVAEEEVMEYAFKAFENSHPDIKVKRIYVYDWNEYWTKIQNMFASGNPPDLVYMGAEYLPAYAKNGVFEDLYPWFTKESNGSPVALGNFFSNAIRSYVFNGELCGFPRDVAPVAMFYNKELFDEAGIAYPDASWDWDDLVSAAEKLTLDFNRDDMPEQYGFDVTTEMYQWIRFVRQAGGEVLSPDGKRFLLDTPEARRGLEFVNDLIYTYRVSPTPTVRRDSNLFADGKLAMHEDGYWMVTYWREQGTLNFAWDCAPLAAGPAGRHSTLFGTAYSMSKASKNKEAAWEVLKYLAGPDIQRLNVEDGLAIPALRTVAYETNVLKLPMVKTFVNAVGYAESPPITVHWWEMVRICGDQMEGLFNGTETLNNAVYAMDTQMNEALNAEGTGQ